MYTLHSVRQEERLIEDLETAFRLGDNDRDIFKITTEQNGKRIVFWKSVNVCVCPGGEPTKTFKGWQMTSRQLTNPNQGVLNV